MLGQERWAFVGLRLYRGRKQTVTRMCSIMTDEREHCKDKQGRWGLRFMGGFMNGSRWAGWGRVLRKVLSEETFAPSPDEGWNYPESGVSG